MYYPSFEIFIIIGTEEMKMVLSVSGQMVCIQFLFVYESFCGPELEPPENESGDSSV